MGEVAAASCGDSHGLVKELKAETAYLNYCASLEGSYALVHSD